MFTSANVVPAYTLGYSLGASFQNSEWQNTIFSDNVPEHNDASFVSQTVPTTMVPGQTYSVSVTMRNTGASTWTPDGDYQLASENVPDNQRWGLNRVNLTTTVLPGSDATFNFTVTAPATGSHSFQWRMVQQGVERFGALTTNVNVQTVNWPPTVDWVSPSNNQTFVAGSTITLTANAMDTDGTISKVEFFQDATKLGEDTTPPSPYSLSWTGVSAGSYTLTARATDNGGATTTSSAVHIIVNPPNVPPTVTIAAPTNNANFANDTTITITANAGDSDGIVSKVEFFKGGTTILGEDTNGTDGFRYSWANVQAGTYSLTVKATDNAGAITTSSAVSITVSLPVVSVASTDADASEPGSNTGVFTVSRTGGTSMPLTINFSLSGTAVAGTDYTSIGTAVTIPSGSASRTIVITPIDDTAIEGNETATLALLGNAAYTLGTPASATVTIADNDHYTPIVNITSPAGGATFTTPATISITAIASEQAGTITKVEFFQGGTNLGEDTNGADGFTYTWANVLDGSYSLTARATDSYGVTVTSAAVQISVVNFTVPRLDPMDRTGGADENPLSRNFNWSVPLVGLPGRAGLDLGLTLSYNSLVWTRNGSNISFNDDGGFPSPGFRLGFPGIQSRYFNSLVGKYAYMLITPNGDRVELRQVNTSTIYEAADYSYLTLVVNADNTITVRTTDGTQLSYEWKVSDYECTKIKDRNGNFISINYNGSGRIDTVVDTLSRTIKFNYDTGGYLSSITQIWNQGTANEQNYEWASFTYNPSLPIQTNFSNVTNLGPQNGSTLKVLNSVKLNNNSYRFDFDYTSWGQVWKVSNYAADGHLLNYRAYNLPGSQLLATGPQSDCPRFTERHDWAENWNGDVEGTPATIEEVKTFFTEPVNASLPDGSLQTVTRAKVTLPDDTYHEIYFAGTIEGTAGSAPAWQRGLPLVTDTFGRTDANSTTIKQRSAATAWTQDDTNVSYSLNPRVTERNIYDFNASGVVQNRKRTSVTYQNVTFANGTTCRLPQDVYEYQANATTVLRRTHTDYNLATTYTDLRIIGLVSEKRLYEVDPNTLIETLMSKVGFAYDEGSIQGTDAPVQHDTSYNSGLVLGRANLTSVKRYDVSPGSAALVTSSMFYDTAGSLVKTIDPANHQTQFSYADQFSANGTTLDAARPATFAYPTMVTNPDGYTASSRYQYDFGAVTWKQTPQPNTIVNTPGPQQTITYDSFGRIQRLTNLVNGAYTRYVYPGTQPGSQNRIDTYATIIDGASEQNGNEAHSFQIADGHGRVIASASSHPGSTGGYNGQLVLFDAMGRAIKTSNPTETSASGMPTGSAAAGDDASAGWLYTQQTYDWKGRPLVTTNQDGTTKEASYAGCGCAGGEVVTLTDEGTMDAGVFMRRQQKIYTDILGRTVKTEVLNWQGGSVYSTVTNSYNARDQLTLVRQYQGPDSSSVYQDTVMTYDGYGRLKTRHLPEQDAGTGTVYNYNSDDTVSAVTDARGAAATYSYNNNRHLVTAITYSAPAGITPTAPVSYAYDAVGNRTSMSDGTGSCSYSYDGLSRMTSESRYFNDTGRSYTLSYGYNLAGDVTSVNDPFGGQVGYSRDQTGQLTSIAGTGTVINTYASGLVYRAWGALKHLTYGNNMTYDVGHNSRLQAASFTVGGADPTYGPATIMNSEFQYYPDGRPKSARDLVDNKFDRAYSYDHVGRLEEAYANQEARDFLAGVASPGTDQGPYRESFNFDFNDNMTKRVGRFWSQPQDTSNVTYDSSTNRNTNPAWQYDAEGNILKADGLDPVVYDAAGRPVKLTNAPGYLLYYDGDGNVVRRVQRDNNCHDYLNYYNVRSSVMGARVIIQDQVQTLYQGVCQEATLIFLGRSFRRFAYANGELIAKEFTSYDPRSFPEVAWVHQNPVTASVRGSGQYADPRGEVAEPDSGGINVGLSDPTASGTPMDDTVPAIKDFELGEQCTINGITMNCGNIGLLISSGSAANCPLCGSSTAVTYYGKLTLAFFNSYADGYQGFMPVTARYIGNGGIAPIGSGGSPHRITFGSGPDTRGDTNLGLLNGAIRPEEDLGRTPQASFMNVSVGSLSPQNSGQTQNQTLENLIRQWQVDYVFQVANGILSQNNPCSQFLGGPGPATTILGVLRSSLTLGALPNPATGISMNVPPAVAGNLSPAGNGVQYRTPNSATLNTNGIFFHVNMVGEYISNSLAGQLVQFFHEDAHLTVMPGGALRIPNDGFSRSVSMMNTGNILNACRTAINAAVATPPPMPPFRPLIP